MLSRLFRWLRRTLLGLRHEYIELRDGKYLKVRRGTATIVDEEAIPDRYRVTAGDTGTTTDALPDSPTLTNELARHARIDLLQGKTAERVAQRATENDHIKSDVLKNPELVDADSRAEADLKLKIMDGATLESIVESNSQLSESDVTSQLGFEWVAKAGYNQYGSELAGKINDADTGSDTEADGDAGGEGDGEGDATGTAAGESEATSGASDGASDSAAEATGTTASTSSDLAGVETGASIDTDAGTISTGGETGSTGGGTDTSGGGDAGGTGSTGGSSGTGGSGTGGGGK